MRPLGEFESENQASTFSGYLSYKGIQSEVEEKEDDGPWTIWVLDEDKIATAMAELREFQDDPDNSKYADLAREGHKRVEEVRKQEEKKASRWREQNLGTNFRERDRRPGMMTLALIITCIATFFVSKMGHDTKPVGAFYISEYVDLQAKTVPVYAMEAQIFLPELKSGQVWRVVTPIFLHFNFLHILFNMFWLHSLGSMIEQRRGAGFFIGFLLLIAIFSNMAQVVISGPHFGGMSGVVYGLFGYVWMKGNFDPGDGMQLHQTTIIIMLAWFALCFTGIFGPIANWAHAGGLAVGTLWGYISALRWTGARG